MHSQNFETWFQLSNQLSNLRQVNLSIISSNAAAIVTGNPQLPHGMTKTVSAEKLTWMILHTEKQFLGKTERQLTE